MIDKNTQEEILEMIYQFVLGGLCFWLCVFSDVGLNGILGTGVFYLSYLLICFRVFKSSNKEDE